MPEQMQETKNKLLKAILNEGMVKATDVAEAIKAVLGVVAKLKAELSDKMATNKGEMTEEYKEMYSKMSAMEKRLSDMHSKLSDKMGVDKSEMKEYCKTEMRKLQDMIPSIPSFAPLEKRIGEVEKMIPKIPDEITGNQIIKKINDADNLIDKSAIKGLEEIEKMARENKGTRSFFGGGLARGVANDLYTKFHNGASNITVSATEPVNPTLNDLWVDLS